MVDWLIDLYVVLQAKDISKTIVVKRKHEPHEQNQYIFIPHKTLNTQNYIRDDAIFFEIRVHRASNNWRKLCSLYDKGKLCVFVMAKFWIYL